MNFIVNRHWQWHWHWHWQSVNAIESWYYECKNGARIVGGCCHVPAIIFNFALGRFERTRKKPAEYLNCIFQISNQVIQEEKSERELAKKAPKTNKKKHTKNVFCIF